METKKTRLSGKELLKEIKKNLHDGCEYIFRVGISEFVIEIYRKEKNEKNTLYKFSDADDSST